MGKIAAERAMAHIRVQLPSFPDIQTERFASRFSRYRGAIGKDNLGRIRNAMRSLMTDKMSVFRTESWTLEAMESLRELKQRADRTALTSRSWVMNQELVERWELDNLLAVAMVICYGALQRQESRGAHYRDDYPERRDEFNYHTLATMPVFGKVILGRREVDMSIFNAGGEHHEKFAVIERKY
jgi:succinate dehydrogenase / fumarate reductase flavoprotein subunit